MKLSRIWGAFPWRMALILALVLCLPLLGCWAWFRWEVPPLQRYYLMDYWASSEGAKQPGTQTQVQWLMDTAPGRKSRWLFASDVMNESHNGLLLELSPDAIGQGWVSIEKSPIESVGSAELEGLLQEDFFDGQSFRQFINEPLLYGVAACVIVAYLAFMMREDLAYEWRRLRRAVGEPEWGFNSGGYLSGNRVETAARIQLRITHWNSQKNVKLMWAKFRGAIGSRSRQDKQPNPQSFRGSHRHASTEVQNEVSTEQLQSNPLPSDLPEPPSQRRTIFPRTSPSDNAHSKSKPWDESEWID
jgi:hypothetical protein